MGQRHEGIGIKQAIRLEWMQKTANFLLAGLDASVIRKELHEYLSDRMGSGARGDRSANARAFAVAILMNTWITPAPELSRLREALLPYLSRGKAQEIAAHWAMISAAYPFWFNVARQTGRLLALQSVITMRQVSTRLVEDYGERQTVTRNMQFVVRSFAYWGLLKEVDSAGCYEKFELLHIDDPALAILMFESALHTISSSKSALGILLNNPAFFPFSFPSLTGDFISQQNDRIRVMCYGLDDEVLEIKSMVE